MALAKNRRPLPRFHEHFGGFPPGWLCGGWLHWLRAEIERTRYRDPDRCEYWSEWLERLTDNGE